MPVRSGGHGQPERLGGRRVATGQAATTAEAAAAAVICPYKTLRATQRYESATGSSYNGAWAKGASLGVYQGSASNGRLGTTSGYWVKAADVTSATKRSKSQPQRPRR